VRASKTLRCLPVTGYRGGKMGRSEMKVLYMTAVARVVRARGDKLDA
jgi:hypothetical protein